MLYAIVAVITISLGFFAALTEVVRETNKASSIEELRSGMTASVVFDTVFVAFIWAVLPAAYFFLLPYFVSKFISLALVDWAFIRDNWTLHKRRMEG